MRPSLRDERKWLLPIPSTWTINGPVFRTEGMVKMTFEDLIMKVRLEISEAMVAHVDGAEAGEDACLENVVRLIEKYLGKGCENETSVEVD